jgi:hypothetical protein
VIPWLLAVLALSQPIQDVHSLRAVVVDSKGAPVGDLGMADVSLTDAGAIVPITRFEKDERPSRIALLLDSSQPMGTAYRLHFVDAAKAFIGSLPANVRVTVWTTGDRPTKVIDDLDLAQDGSAREVASRLSRVAPAGGNTVLDALVEAADELQKAEGQRKVVVFLTAEGPGFSNDSRQSIVDRVVKTGVEVTGVLVSEGAGSAAGGDVPQEDYDYVFGGLADKTAGRLERPMSVMGAGAALRKVALDLGSTYRVAFHSSGKRRFRMALQVARPGVKVRLSAPQKETSSP